MSEPGPSYPDLPTDFEQRCSRMYARLEAGEPMTIEYLAEQLGLPFEFLATTLAVYCAATHRVSALIDLSPSRSLH
ncbi:MAG: hypothetical protein J0I08_07610 [Rhizobiales bacterium]|nr:hypothetical protein [Hyphomicrobiales bacterium]